MRLGNPLKTLELDGATFSYKIPYDAKLAFVELATKVSMSPDTRKRVEDARKAGRELTEDELDSIEVGEVDVAKAVGIFVGHGCLKGWTGVTIEGDGGEEKALEFSMAAAKEHLDGETWIALAMDAMKNAMNRGN